MFFGRCERNEAGTTGSVAGLVSGPEKRGRSRISYDIVARRKSRSPAFENAGESGRVVRRPLLPLVGPGGLEDADGARRLVRVGCIDDDDAQAGLGGPGAAGHLARG